MNAMACPEYEVRIADWVEGELPPEEAVPLGRHLEGCPACAEFAQQLRGLDARLTRTLGPRSLPADFRARLWQRVAAEAPATSAVQRGELKQRVQAEYEAGLARMRRRFRSFGSVLDALGLGFLVASAATAAVLHAPKLIYALPPEVQGHVGSPLLLGAVLGAAVLLLGAVAVCRRPGRLGSWL